jgi:hypothetical protein
MSFKIRAGFLAASLLASLLVSDPSSASIRKESRYILAFVVQASNAFRQYCFPTSKRVLH